MTMNAPILAANVATGAYLVGFVDPAGDYGKSYAIPGSPSGGSAGVTPQTYAVTDANTGYPAISAVSAVTEWDGVSTYPQTGLVTITCTPASGDTVNASSPIVHRLSPGALVLTATTATG